MNIRYSITEILHSVHSISCCKREIEADCSYLYILSHCKIVNRAITRKKYLDYFLPISKPKVETGVGINICILIELKVGRASLQ